MPAAGYALQLCLGRERARGPANPACESWRTRGASGHPRRPVHLSVRPTYHCHQLRYFRALIGLVAARDRVFDAMRHVILEHFFLDAPQRGPDRRDLGDDIDAIAALADHLRDAA